MAEVEEDLQVFLLECIGGAIGGCSGLVCFTSTHCCISLSKFTHHLVPTHYSTSLHHSALTAISLVALDGSNIYSPIVTAYMRIIYTLEHVCAFRVLDCLSSTVLYIFEENRGGNSKHGYKFLESSVMRDSVWCTCSSVPLVLS